MSDKIPKIFPVRADSQIARTTGSRAGNGLIVSINGGLLRILNPDTGDVLAEYQDRHYAFGEARFIGGKVIVAAWTFFPFVANDYGDLDFNF